MAILGVDVGGSFTNAGGAPGQILFNGTELPPFASLELRPGDLLRIETPGGGYGKR